MPNIIRPSNKWATVEQVEEWYKKEKDANLLKKLNTIRLLMLGRSRKEVSEIIGVSESTIKNWRTNWNKNGIDGLKAKYPGRISKVTKKIKAEIIDVIEIKQEINGQIITGKLIHGYLKKNTT